jgi:hypothetical protein
MAVRQLAGEYRGVSLAKGFQKSSGVGLPLRIEFDQLRLDFLHAHET